MERILTALLATLTLASIGGPIEAAAQRPTAANLITEATELFQEADFLPTGPPLTGELPLAADVQEALHLDSGRRYAVAGVCGINCFDLNLRLLDPIGETVQEDLAADDAPILLVTPDTSGAFTLEISMERCVADACDWAVQVFSLPTPELDVEFTDFPQRYTGELTTTDERYPTGEFFDTYEFYARADELLVADLSSDIFDTFLSVESPSGQIWINAAYAQDHTRSRLEVTTTESGRWRATVTSNDPAATGPYVLDLDMPSATTSSPSRLVEGSLTTDDRRLKDGRFSDVHHFDGTAGDSVTIDLRTDTFDPVLLLLQPTGEVHENDDYQGSMSHSRIHQELAQPGQYQVVVTSYSPGETGSYDLNITVIPSRPPLPLEAEQIFSVDGALTATDDQHAGRYQDQHTVTLTQGVSYSIDLRGNFDTYLEISGPGLRRQNDDADSTTHSALDVLAPETADYQLIVSSFGRGETGTYTLEVVSVPSTNTATAGPQQLASGLNVGVLEEGDTQTDSGHYVDYWTLDGRIGDELTLELTSQAFDTVLVLLSPDGDTLAENDDALGSGSADPISATTDSRIAARLPLTGRYRVQVTSYHTTGRGAYEVRLTASSPRTPPSAQTYGIFVGLGNYGSRLSALPYTADDARRIKAGLAGEVGMPDANAIVLTDDQATLGNVRRAFATMRDQVGPEDTFVFFFSGHGDRVPRQAQAERWDLDGRDETIEMFDAALTDNELNDLLNYINSRLTMVVLDSCFSGGFSKDVISVENRIGFFSSEEDVTSLVAEKFAAGGYLALFFAEALGEDGADANGDAEITSLELRNYLHARYRGPEEKSGGDFVMALDFSQQHLVVDSGSVQWSDVLFRRP